MQGRVDSNDSVVDLRLCDLRLKGFTFLAVSLTSKTTLRAKFPMMLLLLLWWWFWFPSEATRFIRGAMGELEEVDVRITELADKFRRGGVPLGPEEPTSTKLRLLVEKDEEEGISSSSSSATTAVVSTLISTSFNLLRQWTALAIVLGSSMAEPEW